MILPPSLSRTRTSLAALAVGLSLATAPLSATRANDPATTTPIKHVVVIFQENISFDHYFATYPNATNPAGEPSFTPKPHTPEVNGIATAYAAPNNENSGQPFRLDRTQASTCDENHSYTPEQQAYHAGQNDLFVQLLGVTAGNAQQYCPTKATVMGYFDGNTVTAMWNYAQHFALNDNSYDTMYGPSSPGAVNLVSGNTFAIKPGTLNTTATVHSINQTTGAGETSSVTIDGSDASGNTASGSLIGDARPFGDDCNPSGSAEVAFNSPSVPKNIGDLLTAKGLSWGWFQGGFRPTTPYKASASPPQSAVCGAMHEAADGTVKLDYIAHHESFLYFPSTQNLHHVPPASTAEVGHAGPANHNYDLMDLFDITSTSSPTSQTYNVNGLKKGVTLPAVTYIKAPGFMDGHPQYSNPLLEQHFITQVINVLMASQYWDDGLAIVILYDDSDGWYDHVVPPLVNPSNNPAADGLTATGQCGTPASGAVLGRCGYGPRQPLMVISTYAKCNAVDHTLTDQTSTLRFIEDNWNLGRLDNPAKPVSAGGSFDQLAGSMLGMFDFHRNRHPLFLDTNGGVIFPFEDDCPGTSEHLGFGGGPFDHGPGRF